MTLWCTRLFVGLIVWGLLLSNTLVIKPINHSYVDEPHFTVLVHPLNYLKLSIKFESIHLICNICHLQDNKLLSIDDPPPRPSSNGSFHPTASVFKAAAAATHSSNKTDEDNDNSSASEQTSHKPITTIQSMLASSTTPNSKPNGSNHVGKYCVLDRK